MKNNLKRINSSRHAFEPLDTIDRRIVAELRADARLKIAELGRRAGRLAPAGASRMRWLEDDRVLPYRAAVNPARSAPGPPRPLPVFGPPGGGG